MPAEDEWDQHLARTQGQRFEEDVLGLRRVTDHDPSLADDVLEGDPPLRRRRRKRRNPLLIGTLMALALCLVAAGAFYSVSSLRGLIPTGLSIGGPQEPDDYVGEGTGEITITIPDGAGGGQIAELLASQDVVASATGFTTALAANPDSSRIQPGTYRMAKQMSYDAAMARLLDGNFREINGVTIREGLWVDETFAVLAEKTGHQVEDYEKVDPESLGLPAAAKGELEGFLFPSTYEFPEDSTPQQQLKMMVDQGKKTYAELGIEDKDLREVIIRASVVQGEVAFADDMPKVATVMNNRLKPGVTETGGRLEMDSTIHYIAGVRGLAGTTTDQRQKQDKHNTYLYPGLPVGPIDSPGADAIRAVLEPTPGDWLYFVTVDPTSGETLFTDNYAEHLKNVEKFKEWCAANEGQC